MTWPALPSTCVLAEVGRDHVVFDQTSGTMVVLDMMTAFVLRHRDDFADFDGAVQALAETFDTDSATVATDLRHLAQQLDGLGRGDERPPMRTGERALPPA